jgi:Asp-tRNA(Asn)/Glu-tRNA(Gln) amidotransferase A subunit family amidase
MEKSITELHELLTKGEVTSEELVKESLAKSHEVQEKYNAFVTIIDDAKESEVIDEQMSIN